MAEGIDRAPHPSAPPPGGAGAGDPLSLERDQLWAWLDQVERWAEAGLHARGFAHDLANILTAIHGQCELALLDDEVSVLHAGLEEIRRQVTRVIARLQNFKAFMEAAEARSAPLCLSDALAEVERFVAYPLRKVAPWPKARDEVENPPWVQIRLEADPLVAVPAPRLLQALVAAYEHFLRGAQRLRGALHVDAQRDGDEVVVVVTVPGGSLPGTPTVGTPMPSTGLEIEIASRALAAAGGHLAVQDGGARVVLRLPVASEPAPPRAPEGPSAGPRGTAWRGSPCAWSPTAHRPR